MRGGEIVAIAGIAGNGQDELFDALSGEMTADRPDAVVIDGTDAGRHRHHRRGAISARPSCRRSGSATAPCRGLRLSDNVILTRHRTGDELVVTGVRASAEGDEDRRCA